jgi:hypothetical protein
MLVPDIKEIRSTNEDSLTVDFNVDKFDMEIHDFTDEEEITPKAIKYIENLVRRSYEYKKYIKYLKSELDITQCSFLDSIDIKEVYVSLEFHHHPYTLYDVTEAVAKKLINEIPEEDNRGVSSFDIADVITEEHFRNNVGLVPLTKTVHELAHSRAINIPISKVYGEHTKFRDKYEKYLSDEAKHNYSKSVSFEDSLDINTMNQDKIKKKIIKYSISYE